MKKDKDLEMKKIYVYADHVIERVGLWREIDRARDDIVGLTPKEEREEIENFIRKKIIDDELDFLRKLLNELQLIKQNLKGGKK